MAELGGFYDRDGEPILLVEWSGLFGDWEYRRIDETHVGKYRVVTIWVGHDVGMGYGGGPPLIFETTVFGLDNAPVRSRQYPSEARARAGHEELVALTRSTL